MTISAIDLIMRRISVTERESPLAVFLTPDHMFMDCVFANTVNTQARIRNCDPDLIGIFHRDINPVHIMRRLRSYANSGVQNDY